MPDRFHNRVESIHFVGIGGVGMSGVAEILLGLGYTVSGSDMQQNESTGRLQRLGARVHHGHAAAHLGQADVVVVTSAARADNPELEAAQARQTPIIHRADMLAELMRHKHGLVIAGSHGKTSTTSLLAAILQQTDFDPTIVVGGMVGSLGSTARLGHGQYLLAEADESDGSFLKLPAMVAVVTNIDPEHMDHYGTEKRLQQAFLTFVNQVPFYGLSVLCADCATTRSLIPQISGRYVTYGTDPTANGPRSDPANNPAKKPADGLLPDYAARDIHSQGLTTQFTVVRRKEVLGRVELPMMGHHNVLNAIAAIAVADELNVPFSTIRQGLQQFSGVGRRFTIRGQANGVMVVDDYGHHPTEIRATLAGARQALGRRVVAVFQPHRYSRTQLLIDDFATAFQDADLLLITDIYAASEDPMEGVTGALLAERVRDQGHPNVTHLPGKEEVLQHLCDHVRPGDLVVTLGAGDIWRVGQSFVEQNLSR